MTVQLLPLSRGDAQPMYQAILRNMSRLRPWFSWATDALQLEDVERDIAETADETQPRHHYGYAFWDGVTFAGTAGLYKIDYKNRVGRIGYWLDERYEGRGLVTSAVRMLVTKAFSEVGLNRIEIRCAPANTASREVPLRLGFVEEGTHRAVLAVQGGFQDLVMYGMLARDWRA